MHDRCCCGTKEVRANWKAWRDIRIQSGLSVCATHLQCPGQGTRQLCCGIWKRVNVLDCVIKILRLKYISARSNSQVLRNKIWNFNFMSQVYFQGALIKSNFILGQAIRELKHSIDVRSVYLNNRVIITTDDYKDIYIWDLEAATPERYQRR